MTELNDTEQEAFPDSGDSAVAGRRSATATRRAILVKAREAFERRPYNEVSLKEIAADAGVSAPLIIKYFGSKEQLYEEQLNFRAAAALLKDIALTEMGRTIAELAVTSDVDSSSSLVHLLAVAGGNRGIVEALGRTYREQVVDLLADRIRLEGKDLDNEDLLDARGRAECAMAMAVGVSVMRRLVTQDYFSSQDRERFLAYYGGMIQAAIDGRSTEA